MAHGTPMRSRFLTIPSFLALSLLSMAFSGPSLAQRCPRRLYLGPALFRFVTSGTPSALAPGSRHTRTLPRTPAPSSRPTHSTIATRTIHARHSGHRAAQRRWPPIPTIGAANGTGLPNPQTKRPEGGSRAERLEQCTRRPPSSPFPRLWRARSRNMAGMAPASQQKQSTASRARRTADARVHRLHSARKDSRVASVFHATGSSMHQHRGGPTLAVRKKWAYVVGASTVRLPSDRRRQQRDLAVCTPRTDWLRLMGWQDWTNARASPTRKNASLAHSWRRTPATSAICGNARAACLHRAGKQQTTALLLVLVALRQPL